MTNAVSKQTKAVTIESISAYMFCILIDSIKQLKIKKEHQLAFLFKYVIKNDF